MSGLDFAPRCRALVRRGLDQRISRELYEAGNEELLAELERGSDDNLRALNGAWLSRQRAAEAVARECER